MQSCTDTQITLSVDTLVGLCSAHPGTADQMCLSAIFPNSACHIAPHHGVSLALMAADVRPVTSIMRFVTADCGD